MKKVLFLVSSLTLISGVCAAILAYVNGLTAEPIRRTSAEKEKAAVMAVMPEGVVRVRAQGDVVLGQDATGRVVGYAAKGRDGNGYGGDIELMVGFRADRATLVGYKTLLATETPGLGMKLNAPEFAAQFGGKRALGLKVRKDGGEVEAITSATITSRAVCRALEDAARKVASVKP